MSSGGAAESRRDGIDPFEAPVEEGPVPESCDVIESSMREVGSAEEGVAVEGGGRDWIWR